MKAFVIFLAVFIFCFLTPGISGAQSFSEKSDARLIFVVECDGVQDVIAGTASEHLLTHKTQADFLYLVKDQFIGKELVSLVTGEVFRVNLAVKTKRLIPVIMFQIWEQFNLVGDQGSHILYTRITLYDLTGGHVQATVIKEKAECL